MIGSALDHFSGFAAGASAALVASIWQGVLLAGCVGLCLRMVPRLSAGIRSVIWFAVFVVVGALDVVPIMGSSIASGAAGAARVHVDARWGLSLAALWVTLALVRGARLLAGAVRLAGIARRGTPLALGKRQAWGRREPLVCSSTEVERPGVFGFFAPRILLPEGLCERLSAEELEAVLLHEREHLRRGDDWTNLLQKIGLVLLPLNPVMAWVERRLCRERELACDDQVMRRTGARKAYAACLAHLAEDAVLRRPLALALGFAGRGSELARRVHRILARPEALLGRRAAAGVSGVLIAGLLGGGFALERCPQMVSFDSRAEVAAASGMPSSPGYRPAQAASFDFLTGPQMVKTASSMDSAVPRVRAARERRRLTRKPRFVLAGDRSVGQQRGWIVMTRWMVEGETVSGPVRFAAPAVYSISSYATVPTENGWLVFQL